MYTTIITHLENNIFTISINRADKLNAINKQVMDDLNKVMDDVINNNEIRSVIITGSGEKAFAAGADIKELTGLNQQQAMALAKYGQDVFFKIENCSKPVVAAVNGFALGGGCELAMACHFRVASDNAKFGQPELNLGLIPGYGGTQRLTNLIGKGRAMELLLSASIIDAGIALQYGLVNYVVPVKELMSTVISLLQIINSKAPIAISKCINAINNSNAGNQGYEVELTGFSECFNTEDMKEGTSAFIEKRKPNFTGK